MKIWYDAGTGKQIRYGVNIAKRLRTLKHNVILTTRKHPDTLGLAQALGERVIVVGKYDPSSLGSRLLQSSKRQLQLSKLFIDSPPNVAISHQSPELCRVAFGLGIPIVTTWDNPHAMAQNRLTLPLANFVIVSRAIPPDFTQRLGVQQVVTFDGVDEIAWIKGFQPDELEYGRPLIVVRQTETGAAYAKGKEGVTEELAFKLRELGNVIYLPRYERRKRKGLIVPEDFVDSTSLTARADLVVSSGGTIAREAALQGTPSIVVKTFDKLYVNDYVARKNFPLFTVDADEVLEYAGKYIGKKFNVDDSLAKMENPVDMILDIVEKISTNVAAA
ncbi:MAG: DUF354 domain-containing protein [Candidatus Bathyarchaeota archaeon]|nr:MAG: DUF354 domain-containing protein [Candidatus Bathyarchaeota archaeon]